MPHKRCIVVGMNIDIKNFSSLETTHNIFLWSTQMCVCVSTYAFACVHIYVYTYICMCTHVYVHMYIYMCVYKHVCVYTCLLTCVGACEGQRLISRCLPHSLPLFWNNVSHKTWSLLFYWMDWPANPCRAGIVSRHPAFHIGARGLNSDSHAFTVSILPTRSSP